MCGLPHCSGDDPHIYVCTSPACPPLSRQTYAIVSLRNFCVALWRQANAGPRDGRDREARERSCVVPRGGRSRCRPPAVREEGLKSNFRFHDRMAWHGIVSNLITSLLCTMYHVHDIFVHHGCRTKVCIVYCILYAT